MNTVPAPSTANFDSFSPQNSRSNNPGRVFTADDREAARQARKAQLDKWATLDLKQEFKDEAFMRDQIKTAGLFAPNWTEPASTSRLRSLLFRAGVHGPEINQSVGTSLSGYLTLNPGLPLWAALALVLEATGRFNSDDYPSTQGDGADHHQHGRAQVPANG